MFTCVLVIFFIIGTAVGQDETQAKLRYYHNTFENYTELPFDQATDIFSTSWYDSSKATVIFCHGFTGHPQGPAVTAITTAFLEQGLYNVILLNWDLLAASIYNTLPSSYFNWVLPNALKVSTDFADVLLSLSHAGLELNKTRLVGHSLGAHVMGLAGNQLIKEGVVLPWITGLDPAGYGFDSKKPEERINPNSALYVEIIHSDPSKYGSRKSLGTVDFWPNYKKGRVEQPGCDRRGGPPFSTEDLCNHNRCWEYFLDAMKYPGTLIGSHAESYRSWKKGSIEEKRATVLEIGEFVPSPVVGDYYLTTSDSSPFGFGEDGL